MNTQLEHTLHHLRLALNCLTHPFSAEERLQIRKAIIQETKLQSENPGMVENGIAEVNMLSANADRPKTLAELLGPSGYAQMLQGVEEERMYKRG